MNTGQPEFLGTDFVDFLANDRLDLSQGAQAQRRHRVHARHQLTNITRSNEKLVAHGLGVCRIVSKRRNESA